MQFSIRHPCDPNVHADYGFDPPPGLGVFVSVVEDDEIIGCYDALTEGHRGLQGALDFLVEKSFFRKDDLEDALARVIEERPEELPRRLRRIAQVIANFKMAAD